MNLPVATTPDADAQIRAIDEWWRTNRLLSPDLFLDELSAAFELVASAPLIGHPYRRSPVPGTRRLLLRGTRYHVYYVPGEEQVTTIAVWHAERGADPPLTPR